MTVYRVAERLKNGKNLKDRPQVIDHLAVREAFKSDLKFKMTVPAKNILVATVSRAIKEEAGKSLRCMERPLFTKHM